MWILIATSCIVTVTLVLLELRSFREDTDDRKRGKRGFDRVT
jgi:uncharacterized protein YacL